MSLGSFRLGALLLALAAALCTLPAAASVTIGPQIERENPAHSETDPTSALHISYGDCINDDELSFDLTLSTDITNLGIEVWASSRSGADCRTTDDREGDDAGCGFVVLNGDNDINREVTVRVRDIVEALLLRDRGDATEVEACDRFAENFAANDAGFAFTLYFMAIPAGGGDVPEGNVGTWPSHIDMVGPPAPTGVSAGSGENKLIVEWSVESTQDVVGYRFYCDPAPGGTAGGMRDLLQAGGSAGMAGAPASGGAAGAPASGGAAGAPASGGSAGAGSPGGAGAAGAGNGADCGSGVLVAGTIPTSELNPFRCGSITGSTANDGTTSELENNTEYAVAVAGFDALGNVGPLSRVDCGTPLEVDDFFEIYRAAGGQGGGGFCALGARPASGFAAALAVLSGALWLRRRRRRGSPVA